jgi:Na+-driven multidrug efflux pump
MDAVASSTTDDSFNRTFNRSLITMVVPITLQNFISAAVISADVLMLGLMSQSAMAAVSLAGQVTLEVHPAGSGQLHCLGRLPGGNRYHYWTH